MDSFNWLAAHRNEQFPIREMESNLPFLTNDVSFYEYYRIANGGYYFSNSLHLYELNHAENLHSIFYLNKFIKEAFGDILSDFVFFGCDVFGCQFGYKGGEIFFVNIETGEAELLCKTFEDFVKLLQNDLDYYTGKPMADLYKSKFQLLDFEKRLWPIKPFVIGGEYNLENLKPIPFRECIGVCANLAKTIKDLPDGTPLTITTGNNEM